MNVFTYDTMYKAWMRDEEIGHWQGQPVYAIAKDDVLETTISGVYYVVFDDENKIIGYDNNRVMKHYGYIDQRGAVTELRYPQRYFYEEEQPKPNAQCKVAREEPTPQAESSCEPIVADVRLDNAVEEMLAAARSLTVDLLLDGFNYGLD